MSSAPINFYNLTREELRQWVIRWDFSPVHAARLWRYGYHEGLSDWAQMTELPTRFRIHAESRLLFSRLPVAIETQSADGFTRKYLLALEDERKIETVLMRYTGRVTACISSQAGCAMGCVFCATGQTGFARHLSAGEIVAQALHVDQALRITSPKKGRLGFVTPDSNLGDSKHLPSLSPPLANPQGASPHERHERLRNIVLMGMGEPLHNYDAVLKAVDILCDQTGLALGAKKITLSTVGVIPGIIRLADEARPISLAVSLHGATQAERAALVPVATKWPLDALMEACRYYSAKLRRKIFYEWTLIEGQNDSAVNAHAVGQLLEGQPAQVNLIPLNPTSGYSGVPTGQEAARRFQQILADYGLPSTVRLRRGIDIAAGCGQLASIK